MASVRRRIPSYFLYGEAPRMHDERTLHVEPIEARSLRHHWKIEPHRHRSLNQIVIVLRGRGVALAEGHVAHFEPPSLSLVPAGAVHGFEFEPRTVGMVVTVADELMLEFARREPDVAALFEAPVTLDLPPRTPATAALLGAARSLAREHATAGSGRALALEGRLAVLLSEVFRVVRSNLRTGSSPSGRHRRLAARFRAAIESSFRDNASIPDYARELGVSESQLRSACLDAAGLPPIHMLHARLMLEAKRQLFYTTRPVSEIAYELGFEDPAYFARFFTRRAGVSPRGFRTRAARPAIT